MLEAATNMESIGQRADLSILTNHAWMGIDRTVGIVVSLMNFTKIFITGLCLCAVVMWTEIIRLIIIMLNISRDSFGCFSVSKTKKKGRTIFS